MDCPDRIFDLLSDLDIEQKSFAKSIGVIPQTITDWKNGKSKSYTKYIPQIAEILNTTTEYLLTGEGPKVKAPPSAAGGDAIKTEHIRAAFFEGAEDLSKEEMDMLWDDARDYMRYKLEQRRKQKHE
ncbi:helix-turn-helix transcriptional regulator [Oscillibacter sp.]|uniref:helix-turn-helix domain-containing protein n=1 Tax=Oscillibacter sp. TaxID=1945593 RepID=UPI0028AF08D9|nr:helix-turn-helix transcriptional regulator [Oscillibacter sp.]